jgi:predicted nucleic acid-binding protein
MKIVLDTNVVVSGLLQSQGNPAQVLVLALAGAVQVCHDERILAEYAEFSPVRVSSLTQSASAKC